VACRRLYFLFLSLQPARLLSPERASLGQTCLTTSGLAEHGRAASADDDGLSVREDRRDGEAARALDVHEEGPGLGDERLQLVLAELGRGRRVEQIFSENHLVGLETCRKVVSEVFDCRSMVWWVAGGGARGHHHMGYGHGLVWE